MSRLSSRNYLHYLSLSQYHHDATTHGGHQSDNKVIMVPVIHDLQQTSLQAFFCIHEKLLSGTMSMDTHFFPTSGCEAEQVDSSLVNPGSPVQVELVL